MDSLDIKKILTKYEFFLGLLKLEPQLFKIKTVEMDLKGDLNPTTELNNLFFRDNNWLGFQDFFILYLKKHEIKLKELCNQNDWNGFKEGLKARLYRTQFGFLTEYHAFYVAKLVFGDERVIRNLKLDKEGVDFQILYLGNKYNIHIFVDTERSWYYRNFKSRFKNVEQEEGIHINLPYSLKPGFIHSLRFLLNGFGVYQEDYLKYLKKEIDTHKIKNNNINSLNKNGFIYTA